MDLNYALSHDGSVSNQKLALFIQKLMFKLHCIYHILVKIDFSVVGIVD
ncbi:MAG: hypothetical protein IBX70_13650 [Clostridia bacterium]|nr:hypothetical protein [Clostridia bacterium]